MTGHRHRHGPLFWRIYLHGVMLLVLVGVAVAAVGFAFGRGRGVAPMSRTAGYAAGRIAEGVVVYGRCRKVLGKVLGVEPSAETQTLFEQLSKPERKALASTTSPTIQSSTIQSTARSTNLPMPLTSFIGRERELKELGPLVQTTRLLTLTGAAYPFKPVTPQKSMPVAWRPGCYLSIGIH